MFERSRIVIHGNPLRSIPLRTNAQRRSPANPCQDTSISVKRLGAHRLDRVPPQRRHAAGVRHRLTLQTPLATSLVKATRRLNEPGRPRERSEKEIVPASSRAV